MRDNTRLDQALPQYTGIHQFMPPTAQTEPKVLPKNVQPEPGTASAWANPASVPLPHSADDLFNQWIEYPDEDIPQPEVSTLVANNLDHYPTTHHDDNFHTNQEITSENASSPPPSIANQSNSDFDAFLTSLGLVVDPDYLKLCRDPDPKVRACEYSPTRIDMLKRSIPQEIPKDYIKHFELKGTSDIGHVAGDCVRLQEEKEVTSADSVILPNSKPEFPSMGLQQPIVTSPSQPTTNPAHISTQASLSSTTPTRTTTIIRSQTTATTYPQSSEIGMLPHSATVASGGCTENPSPGSVVNFINSSNNTLYMYYQTPIHPASRQSQPTPQVQDQTASPITSTRSTTVQHHSSALAGASTSVRSRDEASKPEVPPNSTFNPTPLKQSWTSDNLNVKEERKDSVVTSQSSQAHTEVQSCIPAQPSSQVGWSPQSQALAFSSAPVVRQLSSLHPFHAEPLTPSQYTLTDAAQPGTLGRLQARALSQPRALELANPKSPLHEEPINTAPLHLNWHLFSPNHMVPSRQVPPRRTARLQRLPSRIFKLRKASKTSPPQQTGLYTPTQAPPPAVPSALDRPVASTQPRGASVASACFYPSAQTLMRPPANSNFHTRTLPITPGSSWNETYAAAPLQAAAGLHRPPQDQTFTQAQSHTQETSTQLTRPVGVCGQGMIKTWIVKGKNEGEWYNVETGYYDEPIRVYPASEPTALLHQLNNHWRYGNSMPRPATQVLTQQQNDIQVSSEEIYQAPQQVHNPDPQLLNDQSQANMQRYTRQTSPWPVQRSYSASSLPVQAPGAPFTVAAPPSNSFQASLWR
ncbi:hypothetical protein OPQ81_008152 [Rhizoctonia solani]|nr:hypothetical protein OPQ81_008152 [Rhizoctonia solani]